jgi:hypothetical protein
MASIEGETTILPRSNDSSPAALEREVDLGHDTGRPDVAGAPAERRPERHRVHQVDQRSLRVRARDDRPRFDLLAVRKHDARGAAVNRGDRLDLRGRANRHALRIRCSSQGLREGAGAAPCEHRLTRRATVIARAIGEQHRGGPGGPGPHRAETYAAPRERRSEVIVLEGLRDEVCDRHRQHAQDRS